MNLNCESEAFLNRYEQLSNEERQIVRAVCRGKLNKNIADWLNVSVRTIENRRRTAMQKLQVDTSVELARQIGALEYALMIDPID